MDIDWTRIFTHQISVTIAYVLALPVAWDREKGVRGAILKDRRSVHGTTTASSIWNTGTTAQPLLSDATSAIVLSVINFATLRLLTPFKQSVK